ncbi:hypothetical protein ACOSP7_003620 [Xanthoceras sorbifolium]
MYSRSWDPNSPPPRQCIYEIPEFFKRCNGEMFTPMLFSIGPFHHGKLELAAMEYEKKRYYDKFRTRIPYEVLEKFESILQCNKPRFPGMYIYSVPTAPIQLDKLRDIIFYDSIFIVELLLSYHEEENDSFLSDSLEKNTLIKRDLLLLENQVPFFILNQLYKLVLRTRPYQNYPSLLNLSCKFFGIRMPKQEFYEERGAEHFTELVRSSLVGVFPSDPRKATGTFLSLPTAKELKKLEVVNFESIVGGCIGDMKCTSKRFIIKLFNLQIPHIELHFLSECMFQNVRAFELLAYSLLEAHVSNFLYLIRCLVFDEEDLNVLMTKNIISSQLEDDAEVVELFRRVTKGCPVYPDYDMWDICESLRSLVNY